MSGSEGKKDSMVNYIEDSLGFFLWVPHLGSCNKLQKSEELERFSLMGNFLQVIIVNFSLWQRRNCGGHWVSSQHPFYSQMINLRSALPMTDSGIYNKAKTIWIKEMQGNAYLNFWERITNFLLMWINMLPQLPLAVTLWLLRESVWGWGQCSGVQRSGLEKLSPGGQN